MFSYTTTKIVRIQDRRLGLLNYTALFLIFAYVFVWKLLISGGWYQVDSVVGSVRSSFQRPNVTTDTTTLPYCSENGTMSHGTHNYLNHNCTIWDEADAVFPPVETAATFLTTRVKISEQQQVCPFSATRCQQTYVDTSTNEYFIADPEAFTLLVQHSARAPTFYHDAVVSHGVSALNRMPASERLTFTGANNEMEGRLIGADGTTLKVFPKNTTDIPKLIMPLSQILYAANTTLAHESQLLGSNASLRFDGLVLLFQIYYSNMNDSKNCAVCKIFFNDGHALSYEYRVSIVSGAEFKIEQPVYSSGPSERTIYDRHGVRILFQQSGQVYRFEFSSFLLSIVSGMALVSAAHLVADQIAIRCMPQRKNYRALKYEVSEDFSTLRARLGARRHRCCGHRAAGSPAVASVAGPDADAAAPINVPASSHARDYNTLGDDTGF